jgi:hypothetical protein
LGPSSVSDTAVVDELVSCQVEIKLEIILSFSLKDFIFLSILHPFNEQISALVVIGGGIPHFLKGS